jgi:hypothetical protein
MEYWPPLMVSWTPYPLNSKPPLVLNSESSKIIMEYW